LVLLVHGYNNDEEGATEAFEGFRTLQPELGPIRARLMGVYWQGENWTRFLYYPAAVGSARQAARLLAQDLRMVARRRGLLGVDVVAHSLGCRLSLELLSELEAFPQPGLEVRRLVFMAAAVPVFMLHPTNNPTKRPLRHALDRRSRALLSLFSPADWVLKYAFRIGQSLAPGQEGALPTALGLNKWTGDHVPDSGRLKQVHVEGSGHSDYWGWKAKTKKIAKFSSAEVRRFLDIGGAEARATAQRSTTVREATPPREVPSRTLTGRDTR
jgi:pimeloyl-ACP methyl ester carboxylesterase